jgi:ABC-type dipeptide/oligopeptide/nickel transport system ATPase component
MYKLVLKIMNANNHLITLIGLPGVGKSSMVKSTLQYIKERRLIRGGIIYTDARSVASSEALIRKLNSQLISENPQVFGTAKNRTSN